MPDGKYYLVAPLPVGMLRVVTQVIEIQNRENVDQVERAARMSRASLCQSSQDKPTDMPCFFFQ